MIKTNEELKVGWDKYVTEKIIEEKEKISMLEERYKAKLENRKGNLENLIKMRDDPTCFEEFVKMRRKSEKSI
jgi:predicted transcriptional regulator